MYIRLHAPEMGSKNIHLMITLIMRELHLRLPVVERIDFKILLLTFKSLNDMAPVYLCIIIPSRTLHSSSKFLLVIPRCNLNMYGLRAFLYTVIASLLWNSLPEELQVIEYF